VDEWLCAYVCECLYVGVRAYACVKAYARIDACMNVGDSKPESCITGDALHILTSALTYTKHLHALSDAESEEARALLDPHVNESITTTSGETPQASATVMRMPCFSEEKAQQLSRIGRTGPPEWRHSIRSRSG